MASSLSDLDLKLAALNISIDTQEGETPPTSNEELTIGPARAHFQKRYHEIKPLGEGAYGVTILAISKKAKELEDIGKYNRKGFFDAVRAKIVVAKFAKGRRGTLDIENEIDFLAGVLSKSDLECAALPICKPLQFHRKPNSQWYTLELMKGGDLNSFVKHHSQDLTLGFRWHAVLQLTQALGYIHFEGSYKGYPDLKLADFGKAKQYLPMSQQPEDVPSPTFDPYMSTIKGQQNYDCTNIAIALLGMTLVFHYGRKMCSSQHCASECGMCPRADCDVCVSNAQQFGKFDDLGSDERHFKDEMDSLRNFEFKLASREDATAFLAKLAQTAKEKRDKHYVPLSAEARGDLDAEVVSDRDIDQALGLSICD